MRRIQLRQPVDAFERQGLQSLGRQGDGDHLLAATRKPQPEGVALRVVGQRRVGNGVEADVEVVGKFLDT